MNIIYDLMKKPLNEDYIYVDLDYENPYIQDKKVLYPIKQMYVEKAGINSIFELQTKIGLPDISEYNFVNILYIKDKYKIFILRKPIISINDNLTIYHYIDEVNYTLKNNEWIRDRYDVSYVAEIPTINATILYSSYDIYDNKGNLFYKKNTIDDFYERMYKHIGGK